MNRQDLKEGQEVYVKGRVIHTGDHLDIVLDKGSFIENAIILHHEKTVIPQFVAEHIEYHKSMNSPMGDIFNRHFIDDKRVEVWLREALNAYDNLGKAWLFGYEVEKEKMYTAKLKLITTRNYQTRFTRLELEELGVWNNPVFEIEEVSNE